MNEQKLKMLLKFEKISMLEEFYNVRILTLYYIKQCHPDQQISLEAVSYTHLTLPTKRIV